MNRDPQSSQVRQARQARLVAIVLVGTMAIWLGAQVVGSKLGWDARYVFLFDLAAIAGFIWALMVTFRIWRLRQADRKEN